MKKILIIFLIFLSGCTMMQRLEEKATNDIYINIDNIKHELDNVNECGKYYNETAVKECTNFHLKNIRRYFDEVSFNLWYIGVIKRKEVGFDINDIEGYIIMRLSFMGIKDFKL